MITLYHAPMACSLASRLALVAAGLPHEVRLVDTGGGETRTAEYLAINPAGKVPALAVDGQVVTESAAILPLIADLAPAAGLLPTEPVARAQAQALLGFIASAVHPPFTRTMFPERFTDGGDAEAVREAAITALISALGVLEARLGERATLLDAFSVCDLYAAVFLAWRMAPAVQGRLPAFPALDRLQAGVFSRPELGAILMQDLAQRQAAHS